MLSRSEIREVIEKTFSIHNFNLLEYQDKYYFQKRILERLPDLTGKQIYKAIEKLNSDSIQLSKQAIINLLSDEFYNYYMTKQDDTGS